MLCFSGGFLNRVLVVSLTVTPQLHPIVCVALGLYAGPAIPPHWLSSAHRPLAGVLGRCWDYNDFQAISDCRGLWQRTCIMYQLWEHFLYLLAVNIPLLPPCTSTYIYIYIYIMRHGFWEPQCMHGGHISDTMARTFL